jgi:hypothetical protein
VWCQGVDQSFDHKEQADRDKKIPHKPVLFGIACGGGIPIRVIGVQEEPEKLRIR